MQTESSPRRSPGVYARHSRRCGTRVGESCTCTPSWQASAWSARDSRKVRKTFKRKSEALTWQRDAIRALQRGEMRAPTRQTVRAAAEEWLDGAAAGEIRNRSGERYKPSAVRAYQHGLRKHVLPELGGLRLSDLHRGDVQALVERLNGRGLAPSTIRNAINGLRTVCRRAAARQQLAMNPCNGLALPAVRGRRTPRVSAADVAMRITALPEPDRALWSTVLYSGLRLGELRALRWQDVDLSAGTIHVQRGWDPVEGEIAPKSANGERAVPIFEPLRRQLIAHGLRTGRREGLVFGGGRGPFDPVCATNRARKAWARASLEHVGFHSGRHIAASLMLDAGIPLTEVSRFLGHSSITITVDRYGHLIEGAEIRAAATFDDYLRREA